MADITRAVEFDVDGFPVPILDLDEGTLPVGKYKKARGTFKVTPPAQRNVEAQGQSRYSGSRVVGQQHDNARISAQWVVSGNTKAEALYNVEALLTLASRASFGHYIEWRPEGAASSASVFHEVRGPAEWDSGYEWIQWAGTANPTALVTVTFPVAPLPKLWPMYRWERFTAPATEGIAAYTNLAGGDASWTIAGGVMDPTGNLLTSKMIKYAGGGNYSYGDVFVATKFRVPPIAAASQGGTWSVGPGAKVKANGDHLFVELLRSTAGATNLTLYKREGGTNTSLGGAFGGTIGTLADGSMVWVVLRVSGNRVRAEVWKGSIPHHSPATDAEAWKDATLASADATAYGDGAVGGVAPAGYWVPTHTDAYISEFRVDPFHRFNETTPAKIRLTGTVPGTAPAEAEIEINHNSSTPPVFALIGLEQQKSFQNVNSFFQLYDSASVGATNMSGGTPSHFMVTTGATGPAFMKWEAATTPVPPDDFDTRQLECEVWGRLEIPPGVLDPRATAFIAPTWSTDPAMESYTHEWGSRGAPLLAAPVQGDLRFYRLGTLMVPWQPFTTAGVAPSVHLGVRLSWAPGSTQIVGVDYLIVMPTRSRLASPTSQPLDASYPKFIPVQSADIHKTIRADLTSEARWETDGRAYPQPGLDGDPFELRPGGTQEAMLKFSNRVPGDPAFNLAEAANHSVSFTLRVWPRAYHMGVPAGL